MDASAWQRQWARTRALTEAELLRVYRQRTGVSEREELFIKVLELAHTQRLLQLAENVRATETGGNGTRYRGPCSPYFPDQLVSVIMGFLAVSDLVLRCRHVNHAWHAAYNGRLNWPTVFWDTKHCTRKLLESRCLRTTRLRCNVESLVLLQPDIGLIQYAFQHFPNVTLLNLARRPVDAKTLSFTTDHYRCSPGAHGTLALNLLRMHRLSTLSIPLWSMTGAFLYNLAELHNLRRLGIDGTYPPFLDADAEALEEMNDEDTGGTGSTGTLPHSPHCRQSPSSFDPLRNTASGRCGMRSSLKLLQSHVFPRLNSLALEFCTLPTLDWLRDATQLVCLSFEQSILPPLDTVDGTESRNIFAGLKSLTWLSLARTMGGTQEWMHHLGDAHPSKLTFLDVSGTDVDNEGLDVLTTGAFPSLSELHLAHNPVTDGCASKLAWLQTLVHLDLSSTEISGIAFDYLARLQHLRVLDIGRCALLTGGLAKFVSVRSLRTLVVPESAFDEEQEAIVLLRARGVTVVSRLPQFSSASSICTEQAPSLP